MISFVVASGLTLVLSLLVHFLRPDSYETDFPPPDPIKGQGVLSHDPRISRDTEDSLKTPKEKWIRILDRLVLNLSDQQLATSFAILVTAFVRHCQISNYHLNIVCDLAWFSTVTHLLSVGVLRVYFRQESKRIVLYVRLFLMFTVMVMLIFALTWSPQYDPPPGVGACYAQCAFTNQDEALMFSEYELPIHQTIFNYIAVLQTTLFYYGYATTGLFVFPFWHCIFRSLIWALPGYFFHFWGALPGYFSRFLGILVPRRLKRAWCESRSGPNPKALPDKARHVWKVVVFPSPRTAIFVQVFSWSFGLTMLSLDRWGRARNSVSDPEAEDQWGFGQLLAVVILFLPLFPFLEMWSGECIVRRFPVFLALFRVVRM